MRKEHTKGLLLPDNKSIIGNIFDETNAPALADRVDLSDSVRVQNPYPVTKRSIRPDLVAPTSGLRAEYSFVVREAMHLTGPWWLAEYDWDVVVVREQEE